jgi:hypothetical protein
VATLLPDGDAFYSYASQINDAGDIIVHRYDESWNAQVWFLRSGGVVTPPPTSEALATEIAALVSSGHIPVNVASSLLASLDAATASLAAGNTKAAKGQINAFINKVNAALRSRRLDSSTADALVSAAEAILAEVGG